MKRRDLLKTAGTMMLAAPAARAAALMKSNSEPPVQGQTKNLVVTFSGAFCFWQENEQFKVMVPPVGGGKDPHRPWAGTAANSKALQELQNFKLVIERFTNASPGTFPPFTGTPYFSYEQQALSSGAASPLLNLFVPTPNQIIGIRPTGAKMVCKPGTTDPYCTQYMIYASGLSFVYQNVDLDGVAIKQDSDKGAEFFKACFTNDQSLSEATLTIHLTPLKRVLDPFHKHAKHVWKKMVSMYPWMEKEILDIDFCPGFDPSTCPASCPPNEGQANQKHDEPQKVQGGPADDCEVPIMVLPLGGGKAKR